MYHEYAISTAKLQTFLLKRKEISNYFLPKRKEMAKSFLFRRKYTLNRGLMGTETVIKTDIETLPKHQ